MDRLRYPQKLALISLLLILPLTLTIFLLISDAETQVEFTSRELSGIIYLRPLRSTYESILLNKRLSHRYLSGSPNSVEALTQNQARLESNFAALTEAHQKVVVALDSEPEFEGLKITLNNLKVNIPIMDAETSDQLHNLLISQTQTFVTQIVNNSNLAREPETANYYVINALLKLNEGQDLILQSIFLGEDAAGRTLPTIQERTQLAVSARLLDDNIKVVQANLQNAFATNPAGFNQADLKSLLENYRASSTNFLDKLNQGLISSATVSITPETFSAAGLDLLQNSFQLWDVSLNQLDKVLQQRLSSYQGRGSLVIVFALILVLLVVYLLVAFYLAVMRTVKTLDRASQRMSSGDLESMATLHNQDELGRAVGAFNKVATDLIAAHQLKEQQVQERTLQLASLLEVSHNVASTLELKPLLGLILDQLRRMVEYNSAVIYLCEGQDLKILEKRLPLPPERLPDLRQKISRSRMTYEVIESRAPVIVPDLQGNSELARQTQQVFGTDLITVYSYARCWLGVPLIIKEQVMGLITLAHGQPGYYSSSHAELATAIASQAAVALENARLYEEARILGVLRERQRLARELHDSVSQVLYGIALGLKTARSLVEINPPQALPPIDYALGLAEGGMTEMRALIYELRPESLQTEGLVQALIRQADTLRARYNVEVETDLCEEPPLSIADKEAFYRVAQEALHNTVKHSKATQVQVKLKYIGSEVQLSIKDNGAGFDPLAKYSGHYGLHSMRERIEEIGGELDIKSARGSGSTIKVLKLLN